MRKNKKSFQSHFCQCLQCGKLAKSGNKFINGHNSFDKHPSDEQRDKQSKFQTLCWENPTYKANMREAQKRCYENPERRRKTSEANKRRYEDPKEREKTSIAMKKVCQNEKYRAKLSENMKRQWQNTEYAMNWAQKNKLTPTVPEITLNNILNEILPSEYQYVGDGSKWIGGKNPDFININGHKKLIELYGDYWHRDDDPQDRINHFSQYNYSTLIIWEHELKDRQILINRILEFHII